MSEIKIKVDTHPFDDDLKLYTRKEFTFKPGLTSLVGCNGTGKSTLIDIYIKQALRTQKISNFKYNDRRHGGDNLMENMMFHDDMSGFASMFISSEGERIALGVGRTFAGLRSFFKENEGKKAVLMFDAIDSGMSVDEIIEIREIFLDTIIPDAINNYGVNLFVIVAANNYEWCNDERIHNMDITSGKELKITDYESYKKIILESRKKKDKVRCVDK